MWYRAPMLALSITLVVVLCLAHPSDLVDAREGDGTSAGHRASPAPPDANGSSPTGSGFIPVCSQQPQICPVDPDTWQGEPGAWQRTAKKWQRHTGTPAGIDVVWEWSAPYTGPNPAYIGHRENRYDDYTNTPDGYPLVPGAPPATYDWERWDPAGENYILHQFGKVSESQSPLVGDENCDSGLYFPLIDHTLDYSYTPLFMQRQGVCIGGGYIATHRVELWGEPVSPLRVRRCDDDATGIPALQSARGNGICKASPHVGLAYTRYVVGAGPAPEDGPIIGCEATVYAWGWQMPKQTQNSGQDYEAWFRNGMLRFSQWFNLSAQASRIPAPDDHQWWDTHCSQAWSGITNWVYTGKYKIGQEAFTDTLSLPLAVVGEVPSSGATLTSTVDGVVYTFPPGAFTDTVVVTHTIRFQGDSPSTGQLRGVDRFYEIAATFRDSGQPAQPTAPYTVTVRYTDAGEGAGIESSLALYSWDAARWRKESSSVVSPKANTVTARPAHLSLWAVLGEAERLYLPAIPRHKP